MIRILALCLSLLLLCPVASAESDFQGLPCAAAFIGVGEDIGSVLRSPEAAEILARYPLIAEIPARDTIVLPGQEVYCIIPAPGTTLIVEALDTAHEAYPTVSEALLHTDRPVLIIGNQSDIMPNVQVRVVTAQGSWVFTPYISLRDGSFSAHAASDVVADWTVYPEDFVFDE